MHARLYPIYMGGELGQKSMSIFVVVYIRGIQLKRSVNKSGINVLLSLAFHSESKLPLR